MNLKSIKRKTLWLIILEVLYLIFGVYLIAPHYEKVVSDTYVDVIPVRHVSGLMLSIFAVSCIILTILILLLRTNSKILKTCLSLNTSILGIIFLTLNNFKMYNLLIISVACLIVILALVEATSTKKQALRKIGLFVILFIITALFIVFLKLGYYSLTNLIAFTSMLVLGVILTFIYDIIDKYLTD